MEGYYSQFSGQETDERLAQVPLKVDKIEGKGLSTNDFTDDDKSKLDGLENYDDSEIREDISSLESGKQNVISDLATIRSGAALGATALQSVPDTYRTASEQDEIDDELREAIPTKTSDLTNDSGFVTSEYHDATKQDVISDLETIRSDASEAKDAIDGFGDIVSHDASEFATAQDLLDEESRATSAEANLAEAINPDMGTSIPTGGMLPRVVYNLGTLTEDTTMTLADVEEGKVPFYYFLFTMGATLVNVIWDTKITSWVRNYSPDLKVNTSYEVSVLNGKGKCEEV